MNGIVVHLKTGEEKRTEFFRADRIAIGADANCDLQIEPPADNALANVGGVWLELERAEEFYRVALLSDRINFLHNDAPLVLHAIIEDGDRVSIPEADLDFSFFALAPVENAALVAPVTNKTTSRAAQFIEAAAIESAATAKRDDAKIFLREFTRELIREVSWVTKLFVVGIVIASLTGIFYLGSQVYQELRRSREQSEAQSRVIQQLEQQLRQNNSEISKIGDSNDKMMKTVSLAPTLRVQYGNGVCLLAGTYDLVDKKTGRQLRYPDPTAVSVQPEASESPEPEQQIAPKVNEDPSTPDQTSQTFQQRESPLTTEGNGTPVEYDFVGTGFHVGSGYVITNRHVVQPWANDERIKVLTGLSNGRARLRRLVVYFPNFPKPIALTVRDISQREDLAVATLDPNSVFPEIPVLPLDTDSDAVGIGKSVVTMGYPSGPDRILAMVDDAEARSIQARYGQNLQTLINHLAQTKRIQPLTTQGAITDLQDRRIVHDAKTAEGGSGAPLFGQSGRVIGVNFGVFTENTAANMAVPIKYAVTILARAGWKSPEQQQQTLEAEKRDDKSSNTNAANTAPQTTAKN